MDLDEIRALVAVADHGSVKAASRALNVDRSTLRRRIDALESRVGADLLLRDHRGAALTHTGRAMVERGRDLIREADQLLAIGRGDVEPSGRLTVLAPTGMPPRAYAFVQRMLLDLMPRIRVRFVESEDPLAEQHESADVVFHWAPRVPGDTWRTHRVVHAPIRALASPGWLADHGAPASMRDLLTSHRILAWRAPGVDLPQFRDADGLIIEYEPAVEAASPITLFFMAAGSGGVALVPEGGIDIAGIKQGDLVSIFEDARGPVYALHLSYRAVLRADPRVSRLIDMIEQFVAARAEDIGHDEVFASTRLDESEPADS